MVGFRPETGHQAMPGEQRFAVVDRQLATDIVSAYVRSNQVGSNQLPSLILTVVLSRRPTAWGHQKRDNLPMPTLCVLLITIGLPPGDTHLADRGPHRFSEHRVNARTPVLYRAVE